MGEESVEMSVEIPVSVQNECYLFSFQKNLMETEQKDDKTQTVVWWECQDQEEKDAVQFMVDWTELFLQKNSTSYFAFSFSFPGGEKLSEKQMLERIYTKKSDSFSFVSLSPFLATTTAENENDKIDENGEKKKDKKKKDEKPLQRIEERYIFESAECNTDIHNFYGRDWGRDCGRDDHNNDRGDDGCGDYGWGDDKKSAAPPNFFFRRNNKSGSSGSKKEPMGREDQKKESRQEEGFMLSVSKECKTLLDQFLLLQKQQQHLRNIDSWEDQSQYKSQSDNTVGNKKWRPSPLFYKITNVAVFFQNFILIEALAQWVGEMILFYS